MASLDLARELASRVRLSEDKLTKKKSATSFNGHEHRDSMLRHGLLISESMTPLLEERLSLVCERLLIPRAQVSAFVHNSADVQADCLIDSPDTCVLRFTSGLVNLMDAFEFQFIVGHELGHFVLGHDSCSHSNSIGAAESFLIQRARELSADRIGFLGVDSLNESMQAIIKTASGLGDAFLRYDVGSFLSQADMLQNPKRGEARNSTHPSLLIRCRALLWFSMSVKSLADLSHTTPTIIQEVDRKVTKDLERFVDGQTRVRKADIEEDVVLWKSCLLIVHEGAFPKEMQRRLSGQLGADRLESLKSFFEMFTSDELLREAAGRLDSATYALYKEFPESAEDLEHIAIRRAYEILGTS